MSRDEALTREAERWRLYWVNYPVDLSQLPPWISEYIVYWGRSRTATAVDRVRRVLRSNPEIVKRGGKGGNGPLAGHCYVACEAVYHMCGGRDSGLVPHVMRIPGGGSHWYLVGWSGRPLDPTAEQFDTRPDYSRGRGCGFLTAKPSKRAAKVIAAALALT